MKHNFIFLVLFFSITLSTKSNALTSPFASSIPELQTPNSHFVDLNERVIRSSTPKNLQELKDFDVQEIIIFKSQTRTEVDKEIKALKALGYQSHQIHHIPFRWKGFESQQIACEQTIEALKIIQKQRAKARGKVFFHCTVGEDRTGYLAGLFRMMDQNYTTEQAFEEEMCENGYGRGNDRKPWKVYGAIRKELTVLFQFMAEMIQTGQLDLNHLDPEVCAQELQVTNHELKCRPSSKLSARP